MYSIICSSVRRRVHAVGFITLLSLTLSVQLVPAAPGLVLRNLTLLEPQGLMPPTPALLSRSALVMDLETGAVLFEKDADLEIPPASLTKIAAMQVAFRAAEEGRISLQDEVRLGPESFALNMPPNSSLMFLGPGQRVTVDELLRGLAVPSGNDAAAALAYHVSGSIPEFIAEMNAEMSRLGLERTRFEEPSGYSPLNQTTAREFAEFVRYYLLGRPDTLDRYHSLKEWAYPAPENLVAPHVEGPILQRNRNTLLWDYPGVDGLKTGFIPSSGYNIALTAEREGRRLIVVILGAPGDNHAVGGANRSRDGVALLDYGFDAFENLGLGAPRVESLAVWKGSASEISLVAGETPTVTLPRGAAGRLQGRLEHSDEFEAPILRGEQLGRVIWSIDDIVVAEAPLRAETDIERGGVLRVLFHTLFLWARMVVQAVSGFLA